MSNSSSGRVTVREERHAAARTGSDEFGVEAFFGNPAPKDAIAFRIEVRFCA